MSGVKVMPRKTDWQNKYQHYDTEGLNEMHQEIQMFTPKSAELPGALQTMIVCWFSRKNGLQICFPPNCISWSTTKHLLLLCSEM